MALKRLWRKPTGDYRGLAQRCAPGTHEAAAAILARQGLSAETRVLDLAAGSGAFLARLRDAGFRDLHAVEIDTGRFGLDGVTPAVVDLNSKFSGSFDAPFGLITAIEIIEHLDAPRHFLREIHDLLEPDGYLLVSTPNIAHWVGRLRFLLTGEHRYFKRSDYELQRHISPVSHLQMQLMLEELGFRLLASGSAGSFYGPLKTALTAPAWGPARLLFGPRATGDAMIYLARRADLRAPIKGSSSYYFLP